MKALFSFDVELGCDGYPVVVTVARPGYWPKQAVASLISISSEEEPGYSDDCHRERSPRPPGRDANEVSK